MKISVIISTYYRHGSVKDVLLGMTTQTYQPDEIIIIDQTPKSNVPKDFYKKFKKKLPLKIITDIEPSMTGARNHGIMVAKNDALLIIDDDILFKDNFIESHKNIMINENVDVVNGATSLKPKIPKTYPWDIQNMDPIRYFLSAPNWNWNGMMLGLSSTNVFIKKSTLLKSGLFDTILPRMNDFEIGYRLFKSGAKMYFSEKPFAQHLRATGGLRKKPKNHNKLVAALYIHNKHFPGWMTFQYKLWFVLSVFNFKKFWKRPWRPFIFPFKLYNLLNCNRIAKNLLKKSVENKPNLTLIEEQVFNLILNNSNKKKRILVYDSNFSVIDNNSFLNENKNNFELDIVECNLKRYNKLKSKYNQSKNDNINVHLFDLEKKNSNSKSLDKDIEDKYLSQIDNFNKAFDIIIINGLFKSKCFNYAINNLTSNGIIILMDLEKNNYNENMDLNKSIIINTGLDQFSYKPKLKKILLHCSSENEFKKIKSSISKFTWQKI